MRVVDPARGRGTRGASAGGGVVVRSRTANQATTSASQTASCRNRSAVVRTQSSASASPAKATARDPIAETRYVRGAARIMCRVDSQVETITAALYAQYSATAVRLATASSPASH